MGNYLNPRNSGFARIRNDVYVDKSGLIGLINRTIDMPSCLTCVSRPRRFGKSFAAQMLCAYYGRDCDSAGLFDDLAIACDGQYRDYLNRYDVIYLDMTEIIGEASVADIVPYIQRNVIRELEEQYPGLEVVEGFAAIPANAAETAGNISPDFEGLGRTVSDLLGGVGVKEDTKGFANDLMTFRDRDDVLTLLIHLGYLAYDEISKKVHVPNEEIRLEFARAIRQVRRGGAIRNSLEMWKQWQKSIAKWKVMQKSPLKNVII